ncbi:hypothetical protein [Sphingomonas parapaucimobilis]|uniref:hypothetical protein n=1 Tax=Sphingomonas parapaucimobilis TaxID=28213 RepID=UPI00321BAD71
MIGIVAGARPLLTAALTLKRNLARLEEQSIAAAIRRRPIVDGFVSAAREREREIRLTDVEHVTGSVGMPDEGRKAYWRADQELRREFDSDNQPLLVDTIDRVQAALDTFSERQFDLVLSRTDGSFRNHYDPWLASVMGFEAAVSDFMRAVEPYLSTAQVGPTSEPFMAKLRRLTGWGRHETDQPKLVNSKVVAIAPVSTQNAG